VLVGNFTRRVIAGSAKERVLSALLIETYHTSLLFVDASGKTAALFACFLWAFINLFRHFDL
jgi:hypothetical protein